MGAWRRKPAKGAPCCSYLTNRRSVSALTSTSYSGHPPMPQGPLQRPLLSLLTPRRTSPPRDPVAPASVAQHFLWTPLWKHQVQQKRSHEFRNAMEVASAVRVTTSCGSSTLFLCAAANIPHR